MSNFKMPRVRKGDTVAWHMGGVRTREWSPAIVRQVNIDNLEVSIFVPNTVTPIVRDGVRHVDDPKVRALMSDQQTASSGVWEKREEAIDREMKEDSDREAAAQKAAQEEAAAKKKAG